jgi:hypothetical protein
MLQLSSRHNSVSSAVQETAVVKVVPATADEEPAATHFALWANSRTNCLVTLESNEAQARPP